VLAARLRAAGAAVAVSYGPGEAAIAAAVCGDTAGIRTIPGPELGLRGLAAALRQADVVVAADTGPLHIACAVGTRVVALFGPKDPGRYGPRGPGHKVLLHDVPCRPCRRRDCASPQCVLGIEVAAVEAAVWAG
jgi:ADP-heptose:LPS heptosyltransferase